MKNVQETTESSPQINEEEKKVGEPLSPTEHENMLTSFQDERDLISAEFSPSKQPEAFKPHFHGIGGDKQDITDMPTKNSKKSNTKVLSPPRPAWKTCFPSPKPVITPITETEKPKILSSTNEIVRKLSKAIELMLDIMDEDEATQSMRKLIQLPLGTINKLVIEIQKANNRKSESKMELDNCNEEIRQTKVINMTLSKQLKLVENGNSELAREISETQNKLNKMVTDYDTVHAKVLGETNTKISTYNEKKDDVEGKMEMREYKGGISKQKMKDMKNEVKLERKRLSMLCAEEKNLRDQLSEKTEKELKLLGMIDKRTVKSINTRSSPPSTKISNVANTSIHNIPK